MNKTFRHIMTLAAAALMTLPFAACSNEDTPADDGTAVAARISAQIASTDGTRASGTTWDIDDAFGLSTDNTGSGSTVANNLKYTTTDGTDFTGTPVYFQDNNDVKFIAYYPYNSSADDLITASTADQSKQKSFDFLYATATANSANPDVKLQFSHRMGQLTLTFKAGNDISDLSGMTATLKGLYMDGQFSKTTGEATVTSTATADLTVSTDNISGTTYTAQPLILFPQGDATSKFTVVVTLGGNTYTADVSWPNGALEAGSNVNCNITINKTSLSMNCTIEKWNTAAAVNDATAKHITSTFSNPAQAQKGDLILKDGTFISKDYLPLLTDAQRSEVAAIVFWTPAESAATGRTHPATLSDDLVMTARFPDCTHGLAVAIKDMGYMAWQETAESVGDFQNSANFNPTNPDKTKYNPIATNNSEIIYNTISGFQNTQILKAYNSYCKNNNKVDYVVLPVDKLDDFTASNPAPAGSTGWYIPSVKELHMLCYKDVDDPFDAHGATCTDTRDIVQATLSAVGGDRFNETIYSIYASCESPVGGERIVYLYNSYDDSSSGNISTDEKNNSDFVRPVCAF